ncbi:MAG: tRNA (adenosine(37)-N6)-threonylcarbamoyltransferase complex ATPase subunit type 1 TsaE [Clostridia bacterium]|jgi:tRNA threonylcarbamoyladenosine biosynthesis protein TsaE|nr:tRNA (adenosine(37)-N6)-threonylcarbamoyltransferase complex ATPase subunit type 1 TsaE [Clostridia bacterium]MCI9413437.1 tRNA (adenosine(37)-N6)-threonylcarbamoyltransferase complex ATPase subunit type 1 TsaE [Clostridia bacterium]
MIRFISKCEQDTIEFASRFASKLMKKDIVVLSGELGSGKTKFVQGVLKYFGLENEISSPTFTIVNEYYAKNVNIYHFDVYRLADTEEFYAIGGEEYFQQGICLIEWGEMIESILPANYIKVTFKKNEGNEEYRELQIEPFGEKYINVFR